MEITVIIILIISKVQEPFTEIKNIGYHADQQKYV